MNWECKIVALKWLILKFDLYIVLLSILILYVMVNFQYFYNDIIMVMDWSEILILPFVNDKDYGLPFVNDGIKMIDKIFDYEWQPIFDILFGPTKKYYKINQWYWN